MSNLYEVELMSLINFPRSNISEGKFLTVLADTERFFKDKLETENIKCRKCELIIGREFKLGVIIPKDIETADSIKFFVAHSMCLDENVNGPGRVTEEGELEVNALNFLETEKDLIQFQGDLDTHLNMLDIETIEGRKKVLLKYEKAGVGNQQLFSQAALIRFEEIEKSGEVIECPMCNKGFKKGHERFVTVLAKGPKKDANVEIVHNHCAKKLRKYAGGRR